MSALHERWSRSDSKKVVILNHSDQGLSLNLWLGGKSQKNTSPAHSIITLVCPDCRGNIRNDRFWGNNGTKSDKKKLTVIAVVI
jgi:hypothetical protein